MEKTYNVEIDNQKVSDKNMETEHNVVLESVDEKLLNVSRK